MIKKLPSICFGLMALSAIAAVGTQVAKTLELPKDAAKPEQEKFVMQRLGQTRSVVMPAPEGGYSAPCTFLSDVYPECVVIDVNEDGKKWTRESDYIKYQYSFSEPADDWCIFPAVNVDGGSYKVSWTFKTNSDKENFALYVGQGTTVEAMTTKVAEKYEYQNKTEVTESAVVELAAGEWNFGLYAFSPKNKFTIYVKSVVIEKLDMERPKSPTFEVTSVGNDATLTLKMPELNLGNEPLAGTVTATVSVDDEVLENGVVTGAAGSEHVVTFTVPAAGNHTISATASVGEGDDAKVSEPYSLTHRFTKIIPEQLPLGYVIAPDEDEFTVCTVIDANADDKTWDYCTTGFNTNGSTSEGAFRYVYSFSNKGDDWLILPVYAAGEAGARKLYFNVSTKYNKEGLEVAMAYEPTVEALSANVIWSEDEFSTSNSWDTKEVMFGVEAGRPYYVAFHATSKANQGYIYMQNIYVEETDGSAPKAVVLSDPDFDGGEGTVKITFPTKNIGETDIDAATVLYADLTLDGDPMEAPVQGTPGETVEIPFTGLALGNHALKAVTYYLNEQNEKVGDREAFISWKVRIGSTFAYELPLDVYLNVSAVDNFLIIDANEDGKTWTGESGTFRYTYHSTNTGDDWFITPAINIADASKRYDLTLTVKVQSSTYMEKFDVFIGQAQSIEAMTTQLMDVETTQSTYTDYVANFKVEEAGRYYIGVHAKSDPNKFYLDINRMQLKESLLTDASPAAPVDLTAQAAENGDLKATVKFAFPTEYLFGGEIPASTQLSAKIESTEESVTVTGTPGSEAEATVTCVKGVNTIKVTLMNGENPGETHVVTADCGLGKPAAPVLTGAVVAADNMSVAISWNAVTTTVNGGQPNAAGMDYYIWEYDAEDEDWYQVDVTNQLTYTYSLPANTETLEFLTLGIQVYNGMNSGSSITPLNVVLGKPKTLPMVEDFANGQVHNQPVTFSSSLASDVSPTWGLVDPSTVVEGLASEQGGYSLYGHTVMSRGDTYVGLPKFSTEGSAKTEIEINVYHHPSSAEITVQAASYNNPVHVDLGKVVAPSSTEGWQSFKFELPAELNGQKWVDARMYVNFVGGSQTVPLVDAYAVRSLESSAVEEIGMTGAMKVEGVAGGIRFEGCEGAVAKVVTPSGITVKSVEIASNDYTVSVLPGVYVVCVGEKTEKVIVK